MRWIGAAIVLLVTGGAPEPAGAAPGGQNWPQWRGPLANGVAPEANPPSEWSQSRNVRWKVPVPGSGNSSPIVWQNKVFIQTAIRTDRVGEPPRLIGSSASQPATIPAAMAPMFADQTNNIWQFVLLCLDRTTGKVLWQKVAREVVPHQRHHRDGSYASASPVTDGDRVIAHFGSRGLYCFDMEGSPLWQKDLGLMNVRMNFGEGSSPALADGTVVVNWDHEGDDFVAAFNAQTGQEKWRQARDEVTSWATPLVVRHEGKAQVIVSATVKVRSYDLETGKMLWECGGMTVNVIPSPVSADGLVYAASGFRGSALLAIRLGREGNLDGTDAIAWKLHRNTPYVPSPLLYGTRLWFFAVNTSALSCHDARTGRSLISARKIDEIDVAYASPVGAAGRIYLVGRNGVSVVIKDADAYEPISVNKLEERFTASPAIAGREIFLRGQSHLYCIAEP
jgi:outer membrane protein assembly factor BamB